jgi:eukaryotic-like serine/threonine-protein kinase
MPLAPRGVDDLAATIEAMAATLGARAVDGRVRDPRSTLEPPRRERDDRTRHALAHWRAAAMGPTSADGLVMDRMLGAGGMGLVHLAEQRTLGRKVAVKTLRGGAHEPEKVLKLLREAWITGSLEHPNVVPVYDVGVDRAGGPQIVLKRIEGVAWSEIMHDPASIADRFDARDPLEWNLLILGQVCRAVHFAHARGVLHRDLKPANVMIGNFGEVYVLDWGIAVSLHDDGTGRFPLAGDADDMAGTPAYMAPEMLGGGPHRLGATTDVYLLGAVLHEIVTGRPPHDASTIQAIVESIMRSEPKLPDAVPDALLRIVTRAMAKDPQSRHGSADELRIALDEYLRHRGSMRLVESADRSLALLREQLAGGAPRRVLYNLLGECRFGYRAALNESVDNERARSGLRAALVMVAEWELEQADPSSAALLLEELDSAPPELLLRLEEVRRKEQDNRERLARFSRMEQDLDKTTGASMRVFLSIGFGVVWVGSPLMRHFGDPTYLTHAITVAVDVGHIAVVLIIGIVAREWMTRTAVNRRVFATLLLALVAQAAMGTGLWTVGVDVRIVHWLHMLLWSVVLGSLTINTERALWPSFLTTLAGFLFVAWNFEWLYFVMAAVNAVMVLNIVQVWTPRRIRRSAAAGAGPQASRPR